MLTLIGILVFIYGICVGSFLNVVVWRLPQDQKLTGRSHCPKCQHKLQAWELIPLLSFVFLKGRCNNCKTKISARYPIIETVVGVLFLLSFWYFLPSSLFTWTMFLKSLAAIFILTAVFIVDFEHFLILDSVIFPGVVLMLAINIALDFFNKAHIWSLNSFFLNGLIAAVLAALPFFLIWFFSKGTWMGFGDVKLALFLGVFLGTPLVWVNLFLTIILGGAISLVLLLLTNKNLKTKLPFGTFLSFAALVAFFYGHSLLSWYLALIGI